MPSVKRKRSKLELALDRADDFVAGHLVDGLEELVSLTKKATKEDSVRVGALRALLAWAKPNRTSVTNVNVNSNNKVRINSRLGLPSAPPSKHQARVIELTVEKPLQKILPEAPRSIGESLRPFSARETGNDMALPEPLPVREVAPRSPDKPAPAKSVKLYE